MSDSSFAVLPALVPIGSVNAPTNALVIARVVLFEVAAYVVQP